MKVSKIVYKNENRIKIEFPYDSTTIGQLKQLKDVKWSESKKTWHIPYSQQAFKKLKAMFPEVVYEQPEVACIQNKPMSSSINTNMEAFIKSTPTFTPTFNTKEVSIIVFGRRIAVKIPKNEIDTRFVLSLRFSRWDAKNYCWIIPNYSNNIMLLKAHFNDRITEFKIHDEFETNISSGETRTIGKNDLLIIKTTAGRLKLIFGFNREITKAIKTMPYNSWNLKNKYWSIPYSENILNRIKILGNEQNLSIIYEIEVNESRIVSRESKMDILNYRACPEEFTLKLKELRYSEKTLKTYTSLFEEFINYYCEEELENIDESMIVAFLRYLVMERRISTSYQNQSINAIKFYYERVLGGQRKIYMIDRPREEQMLPEVLNEKEVSDLLQCTTNIKHKSILMLCYSGGLRLGELINVKLKDIDSERMQIRVEQGKGKKDRYTLLSPNLLNLLRIYFKDYKPKKWLFEGIEGGQYGKRSIQDIMTASVKRPE